jgi:hypothetical protein
LISAALVAANIIDGDGRRISRIQNLVDCIPREAMANNTEKETVAQREWREKHTPTIAEPSSPWCKDLNFGIASAAA